jgi:hypothetical protein
MDVARSIVSAAKMGTLEVNKQFIEGYFKGEDFDKQLLQAFIVLSVYRIFKHWHQTNRIEDMDSIREYLAQTRHFLRE